MGEIISSYLDSAGGGAIGRAIIHGASHLWGPGLTIHTGVGRRCLQLIASIVF